MLMNKVWLAYEQMPARTRGSDVASSSQAGEDFLNPPLVPSTLADAIAALVNATIDNAHLLRELAQNNQHGP
jgi:hypothetical protein